MTAKREPRILGALPLPMLAQDAVALILNCAEREPTAVLQVNDDGSVHIVVPVTRARRPAWSAYQGDEAVEGGPNPTPTAPT